MAESIELIASDALLEVRLTGKLTKEAYQKLAPIVDEQVKKHGKLHILLELHDFHGWTAGALWEDMKFDLQHWKDIAKLAIVGESKWEKGMAAFCKPFTKAKIQYFDQDHLAEAKAWVSEG